MKKETALATFRAELIKRQKAESTRDDYVGFAQRFLNFCEGKGFSSAEEAIPEFLGSLTPCSVSLQKGALSALAGGNGFYACLGREIGELPPWVFAQRPQRVPVWTTQAEAEAVIAQLAEPWNLIAGLMFGSGLRIGEVIPLRWRAFDFERGTVSIRSGKGDKCRIAPLSRRLIHPLMERRERCRGLWETDRKNQRPGVAPVEQLVRKYPSHGVKWPFFWVFPAGGESRDPESGIRRRHHLHVKSFSKALRVAVDRSGIDKRITSHSFRHGFATAYLLAGGNLRELQQRMGHESIETTQRYLHCLPQDFDRIGSPWDVEPPKAIIHFPTLSAAQKAHA